MLQAVPQEDVAATEVAKNVQKDANANIIQI